MFLPELDFYVPFIMWLEQGKGAVMEVLTPLRRTAALLTMLVELEQPTWQLTPGQA